MISIDFETHLISEEAPFPKPVCISYYMNDKVNGVEVGKKIHEVLEWALKKDVEIIAHNAVFECGIIYTYFPKLRPLLLERLKQGKIICTQIAEQLIDNTREKQLKKYSLSDLVKHYFKTDISEEKTDPDAWRLRYSELEDIPLSQWPTRAIDYSLSDSIWAFKLNEQQETVNHELAVQSSVLLNLMATRGMTVDVDRVMQLEQEVKDKLKPNYEYLESRDLCAKIKDSDKYRKNLKNFREYISTIITEPIKTMKGNLSISTESLKHYYHVTEDEVIEKFLFIATYEKIITAFTSRLKHPLIRTSYSSTKSTARTSSRTTKLYPSVNIQQMPRQVPNVTWDVRNCFVARPGYKMVSIDYAGLELASTAHQLYNFYGKSTMRDKINQGDNPTDMHSLLACKLMSSSLKKTITYEDFIKNKNDDLYKHYRQLSKPINLGFPGGIGYKTMRQLLLRDNIKTKYEVLETSPWERELIWMVNSFKDTTENLRVERTGFREYSLIYDELVELKQNLFALYPELERFLKENHSDFLTGKTKYMKNDWGEWEPEDMYCYDIYGFKRDWCTYTALCNGYLMQTPSAIGAKTALNQILRKYLDSKSMIPLAFIHDEIVFEVLDNSDKYAIIEDVAYMMIDGMQEILDSVRITVEASLMDYWDKSGGEWSKVYWRDA